uniref:Clip domain-containing protein n=1 Tax=Anopheles funestus TaxID=62324 RepID=A0A182R5N8_ANOFN
MYTKHFPALFSALLLGMLGSVTSAPFGGDFVFPELNELAIGDRCTIPPPPGAKGIPNAREGICQRVRDCTTFIPRIILEPFDIRRDICYFEVHDPVVCCVEFPIPVELNLFNKKRYTVEDLDDSNLIH